MNEPIEEWMGTRAKKIVITRTTERPLVCGEYDSHLIVAYLLISAAVRASRQGAVFCGIAFFVSHLLIREMFDLVRFFHR